MKYILSEEEFKVYRECRAEIINLYNNLCLNNSNSEYVQNKIEQYSKILGIERGEIYKGI